MEYPYLLDPEAAVVASSYRENARVRRW